MHYFMNTVATWSKCFCGNRKTKTKNPNKQWTFYIQIVTRCHVSLWRLSLVSTKSQPMRSEKWIFSFSRGIRVWLSHNNYHGLCQFVFIHFRYIMFIYKTQKNHQNSIAMNNGMLFDSRSCAISVSHSKSYPAFSPYWILSLTALEVCKFGPQFQLSHRRNFSIRDMLRSCQGRGTNLKKNLSLPYKCLQVWDLPKIKRRKAHTVCWTIPTIMLANTLKNANVNFIDSTIKYLYQKTRLKCCKGLFSIEAFVAYIWFFIMSWN